MSRHVKRHKRQYQSLFIGLGVVVLCTHALMGYGGELVRHVELGSAILPLVLELYS